MSASEGLRIISVAKSLESYQRDHKISLYFAATQLAGRAGNFLSSLRNQARISWNKFIAHAANACLDVLTVKTHVAPWLKSNGFIDFGSGEKPTVLCNVVDHDAILRATSSLFRSLDPTPQEIAVLGLLDLSIRVPTAKPAAFRQLAGEREEILELGLDLARGYKIVKVLDGRGMRDPMIYSPLIWGDNINKAGQALSHLETNRRALVLALIDQVRKYQGTPEQHAHRWAESQGDSGLVDFMVGLGLLDRTQIVTRDGGRALFLNTPHLYGELAVNHGKDVCDKVRLFLDSIRHGQHFGEWHTGRINDPVRLLNKLIDQQEIGQGIRITTCHGDGVESVNLPPGHFSRCFRAAYNGDHPGKRAASLVPMRLPRIRDESNLLFQWAGRSKLDLSLPSSPVSVSLGKV